MAVEDPKDLKRADQEIHINELRDQVDKLSGGSEATFISKDCPPELQETFLEGILDFERLPVTTLFERLGRAGVDLPDASSLADERLAAKLWEVIRTLGSMNVFLYHTDHLSDRQLYELLWTELLREPGPDLPPDSGWRNHIDILGGCSEEDIELNHKYYADERERAFWTKEWPNGVMPAHEDPPYDRDRFLPKPPEECPPDSDDLEAGENDNGDGDGLAGV
jgi:hypothetical protein